jgi:hypothetical protein
MSVMGKLIDEFRLTWRGISQPSPLLGIGFAAGCLALSTAARWGLSLIRLMVSRRFPAVVFATASAATGSGSRRLPAARSE